MNKDYDLILLLPSLTVLWFLFIPPIFWRSFRARLGPRKEVPGARFYLADTLPVTQPQVLKHRSNLLCCQLDAQCLVECRNKLHVNWTQMWMYIISCWNCFKIFVLLVWYGNHFTSIQWTCNNVLGNIYLCLKNVEHSIFMITSAKVD